MRIRLTELGLKGLLLLAALELAFLATSYSNLFFLLILFCTVLGGIGLVTGLRNLRALRLLAAEVPAGPADESRPLRVTVDARRRVFDVVCSLDDGEQDLAATPIATVLGRQVLAPSLPGLPRGVHAVRALRIASRFPFGLFELRVRHPLPLEVVTYPQPATADASSARRRHAGPDDGDSGQPATVAGLRPFRAGDAVRDVHWKATARRGTPIVKEREGEAGDARTVLVDRRCTPAELDRALAGATAAVLGAASATRAVLLVSQGYAVTVPTGQPPPAAVLRWLALADVLPADAGAPELPPRRGRESLHA
jgi:uncharacterized protein (DUF58 family)